MLRFAPGAWRRFLDQVKRSLASNLSQAGVHSRTYGAPARCLNTATFSSEANVVVTLNASVSQPVKILPRWSRNACGPSDVPAYGMILLSSGFSVFSET